MKQEKGEKRRLTDSDLELIKSTFAGNDELLLSIRNIMFGLKTSTVEDKQISELFSIKPLQDIFRKVMLPTLDPNIGLGFSKDLWLSSADGLKEVTPERMFPIYEAMITYEEMMEQALSVLEDPTKEKVSLDIDRTLDAVGMYKQMLTRSQFVSTVEGTLLNVIKAWAGQKDESLEETKARLKQDSSK